MNVGIIGCGLIGRKRALALAGADKLIACCDVNAELAINFSREFNCDYFTNYKKLLDDADCQIIVVAVVNKFAKEIIIAALKKGKHVIAEKPLGRNLRESKEIVDVWNDGVVQKWNNGVMEKWSDGNLNTPIFHNPDLTILKTGFNHRFHPAVWKAKMLADEGMIGKIFNIRARYGHGGRPGMEKEWRASKDLCGGGELLDQGVHIIDLIGWFGGNIKEVSGIVETKYWDMDVEDNAFAILKTENNVSASFHVSWTNWKNIFSFEIFGTEGYLRIEGLGGSYGQEILEIGKRKKEGGRPDIELLEFPTEDISWVKEWEEFKKAIQEKREPIGSGIDGMKANKVIEAIYQSSKEKKAIIL